MGRRFRANLHSRTCDLAAVAIDLLRREQPMTLRHLYYRLLSEGAIPACGGDKQYDRVKAMMVRLRESGDVPFDWLVDNVRETLKPPSWGNLAGFMDAVRRSYRRDYWREIPVSVEVFIEKDATAGTVQPVTEEYNVALHVIRGYISLSYVHGIAQRWKATDKQILCYYAGDFNPSGFDLERDLRKKLVQYSGLRCWQYETHAEPDGDYFLWKRLAVLEEDFDALDLARLPVKPKDPRAPRFIERYGTSCAELDALPPDELRGRVRNGIQEVIDPEAETWERQGEIEAEEQQTLVRLVKRWKPKRAR
jgi:hypothetical protein